VVTRIARLFDAIVSNPNYSPLKVLSAETGLHPSTAFRILHSLLDHGLVERDEAGNYRIGHKILHLSRHVSGGRALEEAAQPVMIWLRDTLGESINLSVRQGDKVVYIGRVLSRRMMRVEQVIGSHAPLHVTAVGKLMLAEEPPEACYEYAQRSGLPALTANTLTSAEALLAAVQQAARDGYAFDDAEAEEGVGCIGVAIRDQSGAMIAGLSLSAPIERRQDAWVATMVEAAARISAQLGTSDALTADPPPTTT